MSQLRSIIYKSKAHIKPFSPIEAELMDGILLENRRLGVTGFLVRSGDTYFQYIEGNEGVIYDVLERIRRSSLHSDFTILAEDSPKARIFSRWYMEYVSLDDREKEHLFTAGNSDVDLAESILQMMKKKAEERGSINYRSLI